MDAALGLAEILMRRGHDAGEDLVQGLMGLRLAGIDGLDLRIEGNGRGEQASFDHVTLFVDDAAASPLSYRTDRRWRPAAETEQGKRWVRGEGIILQIPAARREFHEAAVIARRTASTRFTHLVRLFVRRSCWRHRRGKKIAKIEASSSRPPSQDPFQIIDAAVTDQSEAVESPGAMGCFQGRGMDPGSSPG
ncbi:hypothetical protein [Jiella pelagia]|uniref:Uncharacterized protein n=1 Tax=Jiella pelagia TaxID=2986949 RepID=A0ABY7C393_9HYPH|nr:hypothetical protein [Jiella pelagia]WAP70272.1 hypothetical protein OH818_09345 [Jiella pelagia]